jgi:hypothetical protein
MTPSERPNAKTEWGKWAKAVLMQEGDLPTVADCCRVAALLEDNVNRGLATARIEGAKAMQEAAAITALGVRATPETENNVWFGTRSRTAKEIRALDPAKVVEGK